MRTPAEQQDDPLPLARGGQPDGSRPCGGPRLIDSHVSRRRLLQMLERAHEVPLVLVSGPAGTGKTSLVAEWLGSSSGLGACGWISFEADDKAFWNRVLESLSSLGLEVGERAFDAASAVLGRERLITLAAVLAASPERVTLVVDGYEMVDQALGREVDYLLRHTADRLCLVFVGRVDPAMPLYRHRLAERLLEVRTADLAFTDDEAAELFSALGASMPSVTLHDLNARLRGWAAGLRFSAHAVAAREKNREAIAAVLNEPVDVNEYLIGEVLDVQTPEVRRFLLDTCVTDVLSPTLVEAVAGPAAPHTLMDLVRADTFIEPAPQCPGEYRYYPFFRELLRAQLNYESPDRVPDLHRRAADWYRGEGLVNRSLHHLAAGGAWADVARQIVDQRLVGDLLLAGRNGPLEEIALQIPAAPDRPETCVVRAAAALAGADLLTCSEELGRARQSVENDPAVSGDVLVGIAVLDAVRGSVADDASTAERLVMSAERMLTPAYRSQIPELVALVLRSKGLSLLRLGQLASSRRAFADAAGMDVTQGFAAFRADCMGFLALIDALEGYLSRATRTARESLKLTDGAGLDPAERPFAGLVALASIALEQYELEAARHHVAAALRASKPHDRVFCRGLLEAVIAGLERAGGHLQPALVRLEVAAMNVATSDSWLAERLLVEAAHLSLASGRPDQALRVLERVGERHAEAEVVAAAAYAEQGEAEVGREMLERARIARPALRDQVTGLLVEAALQARDRPSPRGRTLLDRSLRLAAPEGLRRPFREAAPSVQRLVAAQPHVRDQNPWLYRQARQPRTRSANPPDRERRGVGAEVVETLTPKELEVLGCLQELLTTEEIAEKMFISVNTVRTHVRSILQKLGVSRRNAAVRRARELQLLKS